MNESLSRDERRRRWAREALEMSATATAADARLHAVKLVEEEGFVPYDFQMQAIDVLYPPELGMLPADPYGFSLLEEQADCESADRFAAEFLKLPAAQRQARFEQLQRELQASPRAVARLWKLRPLLSLSWPTPATEKSADVLEMIDRIAHIQTLRPAERGEARRYAYLATLREPARWLKAARRIVTDYPSWANLEPWLLQRIVKKKGTVGSRKRTPKKPVTAAAAAGGSRLVWVSIVAVVLILRAISAINTGSKSHSEYDFDAPRHEPRTDPQSDPGLREAIDRVSRELQKRKEKDRLPPPQHDASPADVPSNNP